MHSLVWHMSRVGRPLLSCTYTGTYNKRLDVPKRSRSSKPATCTLRMQSRVLLPVHQLFWLQPLWATIFDQQFGENQIEIQVAEQKYKSIIWYDIQWSSVAWLVEFCNQSNYLLYKSRGEFFIKISFWSVVVNAHF